MRRLTTRTLSSLTLSLAACSGEASHIGETGDTTAASSETTSPDADDTTTSAGSTGTVDTSGVDPTVEASSSSESTAGTSSEAGSSSEAGTSSDDDTSSESSTTGEVRPDADWCGYTGTGARVLEGANVYDQPLVVNHGGPISLTIWEYYDGDNLGLRAAVYDIAAATWQDTVTLEVGGDTDLALDSRGAVDAEGNAMVVAGDNLGDPAVRAHRYDVGTATWTTTALPAAGLTAIDRVRVTVDADGDAVVVAEDFLDMWLFTYVHWFYDAATDTWSEPFTLGPIEDYGTAMSWAQDPVTGDAAFAVLLSDDVLELRHRSAATGEWTTRIVDDVPDQEFYPIGAVAIGDGELVAIGTSGDFGVDNGTVTAFLFSEGAWAPSFVLDAGIDASSVNIVATADGRVLVSWNAWPTSIRTRVYDTDTGWSPLRVVNEGMEGEDYVSAHRIALDDGGFVVGWTQYEDGVRTYARRHDDVAGWSSIVEMDPEQPALSSLSAVHAIGPDTTRVVWARDQGNAHFTGWYYACHAPGSEWTAPVLTDLEYPRFSTYAGGEFLVTGRIGDEIMAEYFAAP